MAEVRTSDGVVQNQVDPTPVDSRQRIAINPDAFGAPQAQAQVKSGQTLEQVGDQAFTQAQHFANVQTDDQVNKWMTDANKGLDQFRDLEGQERLRQRPTIEKTIQDAAQQYRGALKFPSQQAAFDKQTRTFQQRYLDTQFSQLAHQADKEYKTQVATSNFDHAINMAAIGADDPATVATAREMARNAKANLVEAQGNGGDDTIHANALADADRAIYRTVVQSVGAKDPTLAIEIADQQKDVLGTDYHTLVAGLRSRNYQDQGNVIGAQAIREAGQVLANPEAPKPSGIRQAIYDQEGGPTSNPTQIQPGTWDQWSKQGLVHEGEKFGDPAAMKAVGDRAMSKYEHEYKLPDGSPDPARVAVAWFSGPGNVAPAGAPQPYLQNATDRNGKSVDSYVSDIGTKMGGNRGLVYQAKASAYDRVMELTKGQPPEVQDAAIRRVDREIAIAQTASLETEKAQAAQKQATMSQAYEGIGQGKTFNFYSPEFSNLTIQEREQMREVQNKAILAQINGDATEPGIGYGQAHADIFNGTIKNQEQLLALAHQGKLSPWGLGDLGKQLDEYRKPGLEGEKMQETAGWKYLRQKVTSYDEQSQRDLIPGSTETWNRALPVLDRALRQGKEKGLSSAQLWDPASKDYVGKVLGAPGGPFLPSLAESKAADLLADSKAAASAFDIKSVKSYDELKQAYHDHPSIGKEQVRQLAIQRGWLPASSGAPPSVPVVP